MGVTINWRFGQEQKYVKNTLDVAEKYAEKIKEEAVFFNVVVSVKRLSDTKLFIDMDGCETLGLDFKPMSAWEKDAKGGWGYENEVLKYFKPFDNEDHKHIKKYPDQKMLWASGFCKTQYAKNIIEHKYIADIIKFIAGRCNIAKVLDEADYYHSGVLEDANEAIASLGEMISGLGKRLEGLGLDNIKVVKGGETKIKKVKKN